MSGTHESVRAGLSMMEVKLLISYRWKWTLLACIESNNLEMSNKSPVYVMAIIISGSLILPLFYSNWPSTWLLAWRM